MYPDEPIPKHISTEISHFKNEVCVCVPLCIYHMPVGEKDMCETQKIGIAQGHSLLEKRNGKMTKRKGLGDRNQMTTSFHLPICSHWFPWVSWLSYYSAPLNRDHKRAYKEGRFC